MKKLVCVLFLSSGLASAAGWTGIEAGIHSDGQSIQSLFHQLYQQLLMLIS